MVGEYGVVKQDRIVLSRLNIRSLEQLWRQSVVWGSRPFAGEHILQTLPTNGMYINVYNQRDLPVCQKNE